MSQLANRSDGMWETNAKDALTHLQARYASLSIYANKIMAQAKLSGSSVPCDVLDAYNQAVNDYLSFGRRVFDLLRQNKMSVEQVVYSGGKPATDGSGNIRTVRIDAPLKPPTFLLTKTECPGLTQIMGITTDSSAGVVEMGLAPAAIALYTIGAMLVAGVTGYVTVKILEKIIMVVRGPIYTPDQMVDAYVKCLDGVTAHVQKTYPNASQAERDQIAAKLALECRDKSKGQGGAVSLPIVLGGVAAVGLIAWAVTSKG